MTLPDTAEQLLLVPTPDAWLQAAVENLPLLLIDHANCEKKAASTALSMMYRYVEHPDLLHKMSRLAREELRHFEQVLAIMQDREIEYVQISPARYAGQLHKLVGQQEPHRLVDSLLVGALIEARSYERFGLLAPRLDDELAKFYRSLLASEKRHFQDYLKLAESLRGSQIPVSYCGDKLRELSEKEAELIAGPDQEFRFHSGLPNTLA
ncbi:MAG: tRNA-(ms[2]io[6]A)-hydroxylase [Pseudomonadales bacterium]